MRLQRLDGDETNRAVGAVVVRGLASSEVLLELGPADGPPLVRLTMTYGEAMQLINAIQTGAQSGGESIMIVDD